MHVAIIGTGIVGTCVGTWLQRDGHRITFVSNTAPGEACSFGNAGSLSPSACLPVGMPGSTPEQFKALVESAVTKWGRIVKAANVVAD